MNWMRRRWILWLLVALAGLGVWRLRFDVEVLNLLPRNLPEVEGLAIYNEHFANARELIVSVQADTPAEAESAARAIAERLRRDTDRVAEAHWQPPWREHPEQATAMLAHTWINQAPDRFQLLVDGLQPDRLDGELQAARARLTTTFSPEEFARLGFDPLGLTQLPGRSAGELQFGRGDEMFASGDGTLRLVFVRATEDLADYRQCALWFEAIRNGVQEIADSTEILRDVTVRYTGRPAFVSEISGGMESDMTRSVIGTALMVAGLFWWAHRRFLPTAWLMLLMATAIGLTLALGGLIYGPLNVISVGFAAILLGLVADYGLVLYQEWTEHRRDDTSDRLASARRGIRWSAFTTAMAFLTLNLCGLPGLGQLGTLVSIGVLAGAGLVLRLYLSPFTREAAADQHRAAGHHSTPSDAGADAVKPHSGEPPRPGSLPWLRPFATLKRQQVKLALLLTWVLLAGVAAVLWTGFPLLSRSADSLRPRTSPAYTALHEIEQRMQRTEPSLWLILSGRNESDLGRLLDQAQASLEAAQATGAVAGFTLPSTLWPRPENAAANHPSMRHLLEVWPDLRARVLANGFTTNALALAQGVMDEFARRLETPSPWPDNAVARWSLGQFTARTHTNLFVMGLVYPAHAGAASLPRLPGQTNRRAWLIGWERLGQALADFVERGLRRVLFPTVLGLLACLWLVFRRPLEVGLSVATLGVALLSLCAFMKCVGWTWNLLNLMALPLLLGAGVDYAIHILLALRRYTGDLARTRRSVGRALWLCAATTITAFGSLGFSNNAGLASLGQICAAGMGITYLVAAWLLPAWWLRLTHTSSAQTTPTHSEPPPDNTNPSSLYRARTWQTGLWLARQLPHPILTAIARGAAAAYRHSARHRFRTVAANLDPVCGNGAQARRAASRLFSQFAQKLADLWLYESGGSIQCLFGDLRGREHLLAARTPGRGLLLVTPHLGNWEFGAPLLTRQGISMQVVTLAEPDAALTQLRQASRARWNIETVVIGADPFGFVELIRRLEEGATVALLVDRPAPATATTVELFGRPFRASSAPAELARATGCAILPVYVVREDGHYTATALAPIDYDRAALRDPRVRHELTRKILRAFEPAIRQHADQWYHFVPIWPAPTGS